ncbi:MAG TPA: OsmC family protein [Allosphingosinicella sp.]
MFDSSSQSPDEGTAEVSRAQTTVNGIDLDAVDEMVAAIEANKRCGMAGFRVKTQWKGQTRSESTVESFTCAGEPIPRNFTIAADEPEQLLGTDTAPNPQELLLSAVNACMMVGYVAQAAARGITLTDCRIETEGELDLRGFLGLGDEVPAGYRRINYTVHLEGDGTPEQYDEIHRAVIATSPNYFNMAQPIQMCGRLA